MLLSSDAPRTIASAALPRFAVSSTIAGGLPGPAQIAFLPEFIACLTTTGPPVTTTIRTSGCFISACALSTVGRLDRDQHVARTADRLDRLVEDMDAPVADLRRRRMDVEHDRVARGDHPDRVAQDRLGRVRRRRDREHHAVRRTLGQHQAVVTGVRLRAEDLGAGRLLRDQPILRELVLVAAEPGSPRPRNG